jgi:Leucine-rich repeat (LRR) protein
MLNKLDSQISELEKLISNAKSLKELSIIRNNISIVINSLNYLHNLIEIKFEKGDFDEKGDNEG